MSEVNIHELNNVKDFDYIKIPKSNMINFSTEQNKGSILSRINIEAFLDDEVMFGEKDNKINVTSKGLKLYCDDIELRTSNNIKIKKGKDIMEILEIYKKYQLEKIQKEEETRIKKALNNTDLGKIVKELEKEANTKLKKIMPEYDEREKIIDISYVMTEKELKIRGEIQKETIERRNELSNRIDEVKAMLNVAETYEQRREILHDYNIINDKGIINKKED